MNNWKKERMNMNHKTIEKLERRLLLLYEDEVIAKEAFTLIQKKLEKYQAHSSPERELSQQDSILITYGDTIVDGEKKGFRVLETFLKTFVKETFGAVHLLPMYPFTSDDGFSVVDYRKINPQLGDWEDVRRLAGEYGLMFDAVINHISKSSDWFQAYLRGEKPYTDYFLTCDPEADYSMVTRPRAQPLLTRFQTASGEKYLWTTFSEDQIDLNFRCPQLLAEILDILVMYAQNGAKFIRLDAIGFLWKELGTTCIHHPKTHEVIKLMKDILKEYAPDTKIITETHVPQKENLSYFGQDGDEADLVYQFPLPPLTMYTFLTENSAKFTRWLKEQKLPNDRVTFFNFLSSHDGIGMRSTEGMLTAEERQFLLDTTLKHGGVVGYKDNGDGTRSPYELDINYQDALAGPDASDEERIGKFLAAETLLLSLQGVPGVYIHSLLGSRNDYYGRAVSGIPRRINREKLDYGYLVRQLTEETNRKRIFDTLIERMNIRRGESAFSPKAGQKVLELGEGLIGFVRENEGTKEAITVLINVTGKNQSLQMDELLGMNLLNRELVEGEIILGPWECAWIKQKREEM